MRGLGQTIHEQAADAFARARRAEDLPCLKQIKDEGKGLFQGFHYLDPTEPTFLGLLIMISLYKSLKR